MKIAERVALDVVRAIVADGLGTGDRLPTETAMLEQYGVSRESLREALRLLEVQGLITLKRGPGGGPFVGVVDPVHLARTATLFFHMAGASYDELFDTWLLTEPMLAEMAARNPDRPLVKRTMAPFLRQPQADDPSGFAEEAGSFHAVVPTLANNKVLSLLMQAAGCIVVEHILRDLDPRQLGDTISHDHTELARAIIAGRPSRARSLMSEHISHIVEHYRKHYPQRMRDAIEWR
jgi:DNA-binding FadR family transcriptional regulator